ncbi:hypothetical protein BG57_26875 [Caballeronia grimmiae]|uniref:Histidine kinase n=1 Tax=Caballeronia grimmiae TaxID=1071679 RepID=A0A069NDS7_9BURK|nr:hypothetical protein BG57_26875 [Caballeronia grimmiae]
MLPGSEDRLSSAPAANDGSNPKLLIRLQVSEMVVQLHELRRRLQDTESSASIDAIDSVVKACLTLDEFLRTDVSR